jgi:hypothetical protein
MPLDREAEVRRLAQGNAHISNAERAITDQMVELDELRRGGHDTKLAEQTLNSFEDTLQTLARLRPRSLVISPAGL